MLGQKTFFQDQKKKNLGWSDVQRMSVFERKLRAQKWIPRWALSDKKIRQVVYDMTWRYALHKSSNDSVKPGMSLLQLEKAAQKSRLAWKGEAARSSSDKHKRITDAHIRSTKNGYASHLVSIIYKSYREGLKAPDIAEQLEMTPCAVRMTLYRINEVARKLFKPEDHFKRHPTARGGLNREKANARDRKHSRKRLDLKSPALFSEMAIFYNTGVMLRELSEAYGIPLATIAAAMHRYKLVAPDRPRNRGQFVKDYYQTKGTDFDA
jgi:hypothetical protein